MNMLNAYQLVVCLDYCLATKCAMTLNYIQGSLLIDAYVITNYPIHTGTHNPSMFVYHPMTTWVNDL